MLSKVMTHIMFAHKHRILKYDNAVLSCAWHTLKHKKMNAVIWQGCCRSVCEHLNVTGIEQTIGWQIVKQWNMTFCSHECFPHPNPLVAIGKLPEPPIFALYPDLKQLICSFCLHNLINLLLEKVQAYILLIAIPECIKCDGGDITLEIF